MTVTSDSATILIADDQEHVREALAMLLRGHGYSIVLCASPHEAVAAAREHSLELALLDMNYRRDSTSGIEGLELIQQLRDLDPNIPIIALTAWGNVELAVSAMKHGASDFIEKPWRNDALIEKVNLLIRRATEMRSSQRVSDYERQDARHLQTRIVPQRHLVTNGVELFGDSVPAGIVGGDYFGVWQPTPAMLHFCVADVSGKGVHAALLVANLEAYLRSQCSMAPLEPVRMLQQVNQLLYASTAPQHYATLFFGAYDDATRELLYVNCGHNPPIWLHPDGSVTRLEATATVIGAFER